MKNGSLTKRVVFLSSAWTIVAIALLGWLILAQFRAGADRNFTDLQKAQLFSLFGAVSLTDDGQLSGAPNLGDTNFLVPNSGWFWRVSLLGKSDSEMASRSLADLEFERPSLNAVPYDSQFTRSYITDGPLGDQVRVSEAEIDLGQDKIALFQVAGNQSDFEDGIRRFALRTASFLAVFGIGVVFLNAIIILFGLKPLDRIRRSLSDIRAGRSHTLEGDFPSEIEPMVAEMNTLIDNNRQTVERARTQVGNLAHSLKTPIAVLTNEATLNKTVPASVVASQTQVLQSQVQHYLSRARIAAQLGSVTFQTDASKASEKLVSVMRKLVPEKELILDIEPSTPKFAGEKEDFEEILGNLVENACKWSESYIEVKLGTSAPDDDDKTRLLLSVSDDGPGIDEAGYERALKRGQRLDETVPGTGLGLSIVAETVSAYGGDITLGRSPLGGLLVTVILPAIVDE